MGTAATTTTWRNQTQNDHNNWKNFQSTANQSQNAPAKSKTQNTWSDYNDNQKINVSVTKNNQLPIRPPNFEQYQNKPTWMQQTPQQQQNFQKSNGWQQAPNNYYGQNGYNNQNNNNWNNSTNFGQQQQNQYAMNPMMAAPNRYAPPPSNQN